MTIPARGSVFLGAIALLVTVLFYFQPTVEAAAIANLSQHNSDLQFNNQDNQTKDNQTKNNQNNLTNQEQNQETTVSDDADKTDKDENAQLSEGLSFKATAYCLKGRTANGGSVRRGIVAADPRVLPLGTRIQINAGSYSGTYTVADTGGGVRGRKLDIWVPNCSEANRFGRKNILVSRLNRKG